MFKNSFLLCILFSLLALWPIVALLGGCQPPPTPTRVILVTIDTLRADHLGTYGYPRDLTPYLDSLAARSVVFDRAISSCPTTAPSHASLFTSLQPNQHRLRENGQHLSDEAVTVASLYRDRGYATVAISSMGFLAGVTPGFEFVRVRQPYRPSDRLVDEALSWIEKRPPDEPLFLWLHLFDPHEWPKDERLDPQALAALPQRDGLHGSELLDYSYEHLGTSRKWRDEEKRLDAIDRYDSQVLAVDLALERLFTTLEARGLAERSVWVITADHGEGLGNHRYAAHGRYVYQEQLRVPLLIHSTSGDYPARRVAEMVRLVDLGPTLAAMIGASFEAQQIPVEGVSFLPLLEGGERWRPQPAFSQRRPVTEGRRRRSQRHWIEGEVFALQGTRYKVIVKSHGEDELYDLQQDPLERRDLFAAGSAYDDPEGEQVQSKAMGLFRETWNEGRIWSEEGIDPEHVEELRALGYL